MTPALANSEPSRSALQGESTNEFLTFTLGSEEYGVDILKVQEIRGYDTVTRLPDAPDYIKGVINLRGTIVPVLDLRIKFNTGRVVYDALTVMIILNVASRVVGIVVDGVSDVIQLGPAQLKPAPELHGTAGNGGGAFITGIGALDERMLILVDIEKLLRAADIVLLDDVQKTH
jgi:purine-binding chemotaxis protein CheW